jgi:hypothetical protein fulcA4_13177
MDKISINVVYVDDKPEVYLNLFLKSFKKDEVEIHYSSIIFDESYSYRTLLEKSIIRDANIIFIDSRLFENKGEGGIFSGEEFKLILKKLFPYIEVIVISQKAIGKGFQTIKKYDLGSNLTDYEDIKQSALTFYSDNITPLLEEKIQNILEFRKILNRLKKDEIDEFLVENIQNSIEGTDEYTELTKSDIDDMILAFQKFESEIELEIKKDGL